MSKSEFENDFQELTYNDLHWYYHVPFFFNHNILQKKRFVKQSGPISCISYISSNNQRKKDQLATRAKQHT